MANLKLNYYNKDYNAIKADLINVIKTQYSDKWKDLSENDLGMILLELFAAMADLTSFYIDNQVAETFLDTARKRNNVSRLCSSIGRSIKPAISGATKLSFVLQNALSAVYTVPAYTKFNTSGSGSKYFFSTSAFNISYAHSTPRCCEFEVIIASGTANITDVELIGVDIETNTDGAKLYAKLRNVGGKNKIALYSNSARSGALDNTTTDPYKVAYGECNSGVYIVPMTAVNSSGISGNIYIGSANLPSSEDNGESLYIDGPTVYEGEVVSDSFISDGTANQRFDTLYAMQKLPNATGITKSLTVNSVAWTEVEDMFFELQDYFKVETIDTTFSTIIFGDNSSGNIPGAGSNISVNYYIGNGANGYTGAGSITNVTSVLTYLGLPISSQVYNISATTESADAESIEVAKLSAIQFFKSRGRAVNEDDYSYIIKQYKEDGKFNPEIVQAWKDTTEADLVNELEIYLLSRDTATPTAGRPIACNIVITTAGGLWSYLDDLKSIPEGFRMANGTSGFNAGSIVTSIGGYLMLYFTIYKYSQYDRESVRELCRNAVTGYFHTLEFQSNLDINKIAKAILEIEGVQSVNIYSDAARTTAAVDVDRSSSTYRGTVLALPTAFYTVGETSYLSISGD